MSPDAATSPEPASQRRAEIRERLARGGLLAETGDPVERPDPVQVAEAQKSAGAGKPLSELVSRDR